jgi:hypothetical protein
VESSPAEIPSATEPLPGAPGRDGNPAIRASDRERDAATHRLQEAFAEGRLDDTEFDGRMRSALSARTQADLDGLLADLPEASPAASRPPVAGTSAGRGPGRLAVAFKSSVRRSGRWRVPDRFTAVVYKGGGWLDLRAAELTAPVTTLRAVAYKSRITILVPPGVRVESGGLGADLDTDPAAVVPADAPVLHVRGFTYKGTVEVRSTPPGE